MEWRWSGELSTWYRNDLGSLALLTRRMLARQINCGEINVALILP